MSPGVFAIGKLPARSTFLPADARWVQPLNGIWDFHLAASPEKAAAFARKPRRWERIEVPGNWQMQGFADKPHYTNVRMPFPQEPPRVPEENPTGVFRTEARRRATPSGGSA